MERIEADATPAEEWLQSLNATCNRLTNQYLNLLRSASSIVALEEHNNRQHDPRSGGGHMQSSQDPPPPPLAADVALSTLQCQLASENICVAASNILSLIRTMKLSILLMDDETIEAEELMQVERTDQLTEAAIQQSIELEHTYMDLCRQSLNQ